VNLDFFGESSSDFCKKACGSIASELQAHHYMTPEQSHSVAILIFKKWEDTAGTRKKVGGQHKYLSYTMTFRCNED